MRCMSRLLFPPIEHPATDCNEFLVWMWCSVLDAVMRPPCITCLCGVVWCGVAWGGGAWRGVVWYGVGCGGYGVVCAVLCCVVPCRVVPCRAVPCRDPLTEGFCE